MGAKPGILILVAAALLLLVGVNAREEVPALFALFLGGAGIASLIAAAVRRPQLPPPDSGLLESRFQLLEKRLQVTEDELAVTARELAGLRDERDFDRQLYGAAKRAIPPYGDEGPGPA